MKLLLILLCLFSATISRANNVIIMIGDGMGLAQISAANYQNNNSTVFEQFKHIGLIKTHASDNLITDSAASATAINSGVKSYNGAIGLTATGKPTDSLLDKLQPLGYRTAIITTSSIVHATPAAVYAEVAMRKQYQDIATQLAKSRVNYFIGGGEQYFSKRSDKRMLLTEMDSYKWATNLKHFERLQGEYIGYFIADGEPQSLVDGRSPELPEQVAATLKKLQRQQPFFLMVEAAQIDWGAHDSDSQYFLGELQEFERTVGTAIKFVTNNPDTLLLVTADHETGGVTLVNKFSSSIIGNALSNKISPTSGVNKGQSLYTAYSTGSHSASMVPLFAMGKGAKNFSGIYDNTAIYHKTLAIIQAK